MQKELIKQILSEQRLNFLNKPCGTRRMALKQTEAKLKIPHIIVITGIRRCGKSTFLRQIVEKYYHNNGFYYINFEDERFLNFEASEFNVIYETLVELFGEHKTFIIDEIQNVENFDSFVRRFYDFGFKFIITGSNAKLLSNEISSRLTGRHMEISLYPFSFSEFLDFHDISYSQNDLYITEVRSVIKKNFSIWLVHGGMPEYLKYNDRDIIHGIYEDIVLKDIVIRYRVTESKSLRELYLYQISNFARRYSYNSLKHFCPVKSVATIQRFLGYMQETFLASEINKFDFSIKKQIRSEKKMYLTDNGFIAVLSSDYSKNLGWYLENAVFNEINKMGEVGYFSEKTECDFILQTKSKNLIPYQVCYEMNTNNEAREQDGLVKAMNWLGKKAGYIITNDTEDEIHTPDGKNIHLLPAWKWMLQNEQE